MSKYRNPGPWDDEPDELDWTDERTGYDCRIMRHPSSGHLCGYVRVPETHALHGKEYSDELTPEQEPLMAAVMEGQIGKRGAIDVFGMALGVRRIGYLFDVHGGLTFSGELRGKEGYWFGFDCAHCDDLSPGSRYSGGELYRDMEYVKAECASLARQLHAAGE